MAAIQLLLKITLLLSGALLGARGLRRAAAAARHRLWSAVFVAALVLPFAGLALPPIAVPLPAALSSYAVPRQVAPAVPAPAIAVAPASPVPLPASRAQQTSRDASAAASGTHGSGPALVSHGRSSARLALPPLVPEVLIGAWLLGAALTALVLLLSLVRVRRLAGDAEEVDAAPWRQSADAVGARLGLRRRARLLAHARVRTPMASGWRRPVVFLPLAARTWDAQRREIVLAHELAHVAANDPLRHVVARLAFAMYWFHPLAWRAARLAEAAREQACDAAVLALGTRPSVYARVLLDFAESMQPSPDLAGALPMIEASQLETRLMSILDDTVRPATRRLSLFSAVAVVLFAAPLAAAHVAAPVQRATRLDRGVALPVVHALGSSHVPSTSGVPTVPPVAALPGVPAVARLVEKAPLLAVQAVSERDSACQLETSHTSFNGTMTVDDAGSTVEQIGSRGADRVLQETFDHLRICMTAEGAGDRTGADDMPSHWTDRAKRVVMETREGDQVRRLIVEPGAGGARQVTWQVDGAARTFDAAARRWRDSMLAAADAVWELGRLRGRVSSLRGEISSVYGRASSLRGKISSLEGEVSSMHGDESSLRGQLSSLRGEISSIRGHVSSLRGAISSERGAISSLDARADYSTGPEATAIQAERAKHGAAITQLENEIRDYDADARIAAVEKQIADLDVGRKLEARDAQIRAFDLTGKVDAVEQQIKALDVDGRVAEIERQIAALDANRRSQQLEQRREAAMKQLEAASGAVR